MGTVILIGTVAVLVAIVGCFVIWRLDAARAEEVDHQAPATPRTPHRAPLEAVTDDAPRRLDP